MFDTFLTNHFDALGIALLDHFELKRLQICSVVAETIDECANKVIAYLTYQSTLRIIGQIKRSSRREPIDQQC